MTRSEAVFREEVRIGARSDREEKFNNLECAVCIVFRQPHSPLLNKCAITLLVEESQHVA